MVDYLGVKTMDNLKYWDDKRFPNRTSWLRHLGGADQFNHFRIA